MAISPAESRRPVGIHVRLRRRPVVGSSTVVSCCGLVAVFLSVADLGALSFVGAASLLVKPDTAERFLDLRRDRGFLKPSPDDADDSPSPSPS